MRRIYLVVALITALIGFASLTARAQSGRTFYVDYNSGSNSNPGTSEGAPWKTHPYMNHSSGCDTSSGPAYAHQAGDTFVFKGGVTWPAACFTMNISAGGSSNTARDTYGIDMKWYAGGSWSKPIFNGSGATLQALVQVSASNVTLTNLDMGQETITSAVGGGACASVVYVPSGPQNVTVSYSKLHDWNVPTAFNLPNHGLGGMCSDAYITAGSHNIYLDHSEVRDDGASGGVNGVCGHSIGITFSVCHYLSEGIVGNDAIHDNEFGNIMGYTKDTSGQHWNVIEADTYNGDGPVYNNYIHDSIAYGETIDVTTICQVYNNVIYKVQNASIRVSYAINGNSGNVCSIYNNTIYNAVYNGPGPFSAIVYDNTNCTSGLGSPTATNIQNNVTIGTYGVSVQCTPTGGTRSNNPVITTTEATAYGMTLSSMFGMSSPDPSLAGQGVNLTSSCSGNLASLCLDTSGAPWFGGSYGQRPTGSTAWDVGAFLSNSSSSSSKPAAPTNLTATIN